MNGVEYAQYVLGGKRKMAEATKQSTVSWQEALLYLAIAALVSAGMFLGFGYVV
jgi:hypothetical protein